MSSKNKVNTSSVPSARANFRNNRNSSEKEYIHNDKLPLKSIQGRRCLTKCIPRGEVYLHPILLTTVRDPLDSCAIEPVYTRNKKYAKIHNMVWADTCKIEDNLTFHPPNELDSILSSFYFNSYDFLSEIYDLHSFDQIIYWTLENDHLPFDTIKRVHNCGWKVYGNKLEEISNTVIEYYYNISKTYWLKDYVKTIENDYSFDFVAKNTDYQDNDIDSVEKKIFDVLYTKIYNYGFFSYVIKKYVYEYENKWEQINSHYDNLKKFIYAQIIERIENGIQ